MRGSAIISAGMGQVQTSRTTWGRGTATTESARIATAMGRVHAQPDGGDTPGQGQRGLLQLRDEFTHNLTDR